MSVFILIDFSFVSGKQIEPTGDIADTVIQSVEDLAGIDWHQQIV